jgi:pre-rRNA-processing protein TSR1
MLGSGNLQQGNRSSTFTVWKLLFPYCILRSLTVCFIFRPLFSSDSINCNKHKMERFLHHGRFSVASVYAPICFPPLPLIVLKNRDGEQPVIAAVGSLKCVDSDRIILKKIVLTG